jgi:amicyanin
MVLARRPLLLLALAAATLAAVLAVALGHTGSTANAAAAKTVKIDIKDYAFSKPKLTIKVGTKVTWTNRDDMQHSATQSKAGGPKGPLLDQGKRYTWTATKAGTFNYHCKPHPFMKGTVVVKK